MKKTIDERALELAVDSISGRFCDECPADKTCPLKIGEVVTVFKCREILVNHFRKMAREERE